MRLRNKLTEQDADTEREFQEQFQRSLKETLGIIKEVTDNLKKIERNAKRGGDAVRKGILQLGDVKRALWEVRSKSR